MKVIAGASPVSEGFKQYPPDINLTTGVSYYDWYVDSVNGNDANSGKYPSEPLRTIAGLTANPVLAGDSIGLAAGSVWYESFAIPANNITVQKYGGGADPIFDQRDAVLASAWSKTAGRTFVYEATVITDGLAGKTWVRAWENAVGMIRATSVANCDATANSYYPSSDVTAGAITLYIHASDDSDPRISGMMYRYTRRQYGVSSTGRTGILLDGIHTIANLHLDGSIHLGNASTGRNLLVEDGTAHNIILRPGTNLENVDCHNSYYAGGSATMIVLNDAVIADEPSTFTDCICRQDVKGVAISGFYCHNSVSGEFGKLIFDDCEFTNTNAAVGAFNTPLVVLDGCTVRDNDTGINILNPGVAYVLLNHTHIGSNNNALTIQSPNMVFWAGGTVQMTTSLNQTIYISADAMVTIQDVTFDGGVGSCIWMACTAGADDARIDVHHNIFTNYDNYIYYLPSTPFLTSDYNDFEFANNRFHYDITLYATLVAWQAAGYDTHSFV